MSDDPSRAFVSYVREVIREDYLRGVPNYVASQISSDAAKTLMTYLKRHVQQVSKDPREQRQMLEVASKVANSLEADMTKLIEEKIFLFSRTA